MHIKSFSVFNEDRVNEVVVIFGRFQPPSIGHAKVFTYAASIAKGNNYRIFTSQTNDKKKNPLSYSDKIKFLRKLFPEHGRNIISDTSIKTILDALVKVNEQGFSRVKIVVGSDRVDEISSLVKKYNGVKLTSGESYDFIDGIQVLSAGTRDPDADETSAMSATKLRSAVQNNDLATFTKGLPKNDKVSLELFNALRVGMGLKESYVSRKHIQLPSVGEVRENYINGSFKINDKIRLCGTDQTGIITECGANYVTVEINGKSKRTWLSSIEHLNK
jgi:nicotinamide mononucleotide adenylyltransferase